MPSGPRARSGPELGANVRLNYITPAGFAALRAEYDQLLGDELDGPRGRIYLMKQVLEGAPVTDRTQLHLDRCLTCRACETTCPSGVEYGRLVDIGRAVVDARVRRAPLVPRCSHLSHAAGPVAGDKYQRVVRIDIATGAGGPAIATYFVSRYASRPSCPPSRAMPDAFTPPKGAAAFETRP